MNQEQFVKRVLSLYARGIRPSEIARDLDVGANIIYRITRGLPAPPREKALVNTLRVVGDLLNPRENQSAIGKRHNMSRARVSQIRSACVEAGLLKKTLDKVRADG